jgi:hypothetical protein
VAAVPGDLLDPPLSPRSWEAPKGELASSGALPCVRFSRRCIRFDADDLAKFIAEHEHGSEESLTGAP